MCRKIVMLLLVMCVTSISQGATVVNETFTDGDRALGSDSQDVAWYKVNEGTAGNMAITIANDAVLGGGKSLQMVPTGATRKALVANFADTSISNVGNSISLSFDFRFTSIVNSQRNFRFGLLNSSSTVVNNDQLAGDASGQVAGNDVGYFGAFSVGTSVGARTVKDKATNAYLLGSPTTPSDMVTVLDATTFAGITNLSKHTAQLILTRDFDTVDHLNIDLYLDGTLITAGGVSGDDRSLASGTTTFNEICISSYANDIGFAIDNVAVNVIPEPATMAILGLGGLFISRRRRL